jgi:FG-GAP repeat
LCRSDVPFHAQLIVEGWSQRQITGNEDQTIKGNCTSSYNGFATDIEGEWAVSGIVGGQEGIEIYKRINGGWSLYQKIASPSEVACDFGWSVAISGNRIVVGAPNNPVLANNAIYVYTFDGSTCLVHLSLQTKYGPVAMRSLIPLPKTWIAH